MKALYIVTTNQFHGGSSE